MSDKIKIVTDLEYFKNLEQLNHLILSGGGLGGSLYIYFLDTINRLNDKEIDIFDKTDVFTANSIGSIITLFLILQYSITQLNDIINDFAEILNVSNFISPSLTLLKLTSFSGSYFSSTRLRKTIEKYIKESPLNKNIKNYNLGLNEITPDNLTIDLINKIYPNKIFNFITYNLNKSKIEIFSSTDIFSKNNNQKETTDDNLENEN